MNVFFFRNWCKNNPGHLQAVIALLEDVAKGAWYAPRVLQIMSCYIEVCVRPPHPHQELEPYLNDILAHAILPQCCYTEEDQEEWDTDPMEVIRKNSSSGFQLMVEELYDPQNAAVVLIKKVMDIKRVQARCLDPLMDTILSTCKLYRQAHGAVFLQRL